MESNYVDLVEVRLLRLILELLSMRSEKDVVCELQIPVIIKAHVSHTDSSVDRSCGQSVGIWLHTDAHDGTLEIAFAVSNILILHELLDLDYRNLRVSAANHKVGHRKVHDHRNVLEFHSQNWLRISEVPKNQVLILTDCHQKHLVLNRD